jgi:hypothetical protein
MSAIGKSRNYHALPPVACIRTLLAGRFFSASLNWSHLIEIKEQLVDASLPKIRRLRATPVNVPLARPHPTASGVVSSAPLVLMDLETDQGLTGHAYVFCYNPIAELIRVRLRLDICLA